MSSMASMGSIVELFEDLFGTLFEGLQTFLGYFFRGVLLVILALIYLPAFFITTTLNKTFEDMLKEFGL